MSIDFNTITSTNLLILLIAAVVFTPIAAVVIKKIGIKKLGPIELEHSSQAANALVMRELDELDTQLREKIWVMTRQLVSKATPPAKGQCHLGKTALREAIMNPLQERTICNHFTSRLTCENINEYRKELLINIHDYYTDIYAPTQAIACAAGFMPGKWADVKPYYEKLVNEWIRHTASLVMQTCEKKVDVYKTALKLTTNTYWEDVFKDCKHKNEVYIENIKRLMNG